MPDIKTLCRDIEQIRQAISVLVNRVSRLELEKQVEEKFNTSAPSAALTASPVVLKPATPSAQPEEKDEESVKAGDPAEVLPSHVADMQKMFGKKKKKNNVNVFDIIEDREVEREISDAESAVHRALDQFESNIKDEKNAQKSVDEIEKQLDKKIKEDINEEFKKLKQDQADAIAKAKLESQDFVVDSLVKIFGIRFIRKVAPSELNAFLDLKSMANNVRFIDRQVQNGINKSVAAKVEAGQMTMGEAGEAAGFMSTEAIGAQIGGGALIGLYIFENIPKIAGLLRDSADFITGISDMLFETKTGKLMAWLDKEVANLTSIKAAFTGAGDYLEAAGVMEFDAEMGDVTDVANRVRSVTASQERIKEAGERWVKRRRQKAEKDMMFKQTEAMIESMMKSVGLK